MNEMEFEKMLIDQLDTLPPDDALARDITPWKKSMKYILWGLFLMLMDIDLFGVDTSVLIQTSGYICILLGFRGIRDENIFFKVCYIGAIVVSVRHIIYVLLDISIWREKMWLPPTEVAFIFSFVAYMLIYVSLWLGVWTMESKVGMGKHSKSTILLPVSYVMLCILAVLETTSIIAVLWLVLYICLLVGLYKVYKSFESTGYVIKASTIKVPNWVITISVIAVVAIGFWGVSVFNKYPMKWEKYEVSQTVELEDMKLQLIEQGVPEYVLNDLSSEDILQCAGASAVVVENEVINANTGADAKLLKLMSYAFCLDEETSRWKIVHYFIWDGEPSFYGTEAISYRGEYVMDAQNISGYVMYDDGDVTYRAPYYRTDYVDYVTPFLGEKRKNLFTGFSFDRRGSNYRGYITYEIVTRKTELSLISITMDYYHQNWITTYPAQTAWERGENEAKTLFFSDDWEIFSKLRNEMQIWPWNENGDLDIDQP